MTSNERLASTDLNDRNDPIQLVVKKREQAIFFDVFVLSMRLTRLIMSQFGMSNSLI